MMSGFHHEIEGDPNKIQSLLVELDNIIADGLFAPEKEAYDEACRQNPDYARDDLLKTRFLKVENYNTGLAAHRICQYFDFKLQWFGEELLGRPLSIADLSSDDLAVLQRGELQILQEQDSQGRKIAFYCNSSWRKENKNSDHGVDSVLGTTAAKEALRDYEAVSTTTLSRTWLSYYHLQRSSSALEWWLFSSSREERGSSTSTWQSEDSIRWFRYYSS